jgi:uncharacterized protein YdaU (DUF1376 family)
LVSVSSRVVDCEVRDHRNSDGGHQRDAERGAEDAIKEIKHSKMKTDANRSYKTKENEPDWNPFPDQLVGHQEKVLKADIDVELAFPLLPVAESERNFGNSDGGG